MALCTQTGNPYVEGEEIAYIRRQTRLANGGNVQFVAMILGQSGTPVQNGTTV